MLQTLHKEIGKLIHMNRVVYFKFSEENRSLLMMNTFNLSFYSHVNIDQRTKAETQPNLNNTPEQTSSGSSNVLRNI